MSMMIITGVFWGWIANEWKSAPRAAMHCLNSGIVLQLAFIVVLGLVA